jgi:dTDP-4-amino-4,6-dideoxygalactose transaminase
VIEDACQAHGAEYGGKRAGSLGDAGCFSFYPGKNLGAYGEAGAVVSDDEELMQQIEMLRDHGQSEKYKHARVGWNCRMDGFQGAILSVKLKRLPDWTEQRRNNAAIYDELLANVEGVEPLPEAEGRKHAYHLYEVHVANRAEVMKRLGEREIACGLHYPTPIHLQDAYASMGLGRGSFPVAERGAEELLSLPMFPELTRGQIEAVVEAIASV